MMNELVVPQTQFNDTVDKILKRSEYRHLRNAFRDLIDRVKEALKDWIFAFLKKTFGNIKNASSVSDSLSTIFMIIGILAILAIVIIIVIKFNKTFDKKRRVKEILGEKIDSRTTPQSLRDKALSFLKEGDYRAAVRFDFIGLLLLMHEKNIVYLDETKTNEEIYNYLKKQGFKDIKSFKSLINIFNDSWYGHKKVEGSLYEVWNKTINAFWNEVMEHEEKDK